MNHTMTRLGRRNSHAKWIAEVGGAKFTERDLEDIEFCTPLYAGVCMINNPTELPDFSLSAINCQS